MSGCSAFVAHLRAPRPFVAGIRTGIHALTFSTMLGIASMILLSGHTLETSQGYRWFLAHWPHTDRGWGLAFGAFAVCGSLDWLVGDRAQGSWSAYDPIAWFRRRRIVRFGSCVALAAGHMTFAHGVWAVNPISTGVAVYSVLAGASLVAIVLAILEDW